MHGTYNRGRIERRVVGLDTRAKTISNGRPYEGGLRYCGHPEDHNYQG